MKRMILVLAAVAMFASAANATVFVQDTFSRPVGNLVGTNPDVGGTWTAHSAAGLTPLQIVNDGAPVGGPNAAYLAQGSGSREDANTLFANGEVAGAGKKYYAGFCVKVTGGADGTIDNVYFAHFSDAGTAAFTARVGVTDGAADYKFAIFSGSTTLGATYPTDYVLGTWHRVVTSYAYDTGTTEMWVDPIPTLGENDPGQVTKITATGTTTAIKAYAFRQATGDTNQTIDNLLVGTAFSEVAAPCVPEPATLGFLSLGVLALIRRRR